MKIYCGKNLKGKWRASIDESKIKKLGNLFSCELEQIHNGKVYMVTCYSGYDFDNARCRIQNVERYSKLYHSVRASKNDMIWTEAVAESEKNPENFHVTDFSIASDDDTGSPFTYGDVKEGKFNVKIIGIRVEGIDTE